MSNKLKGIVGVPRGAEKRRGLRPRWAYDPKAARKRWFRLHPEQRPKRKPKADPPVEAVQRGPLDHKRMEIVERSIGPVFPER